MIWHIFKKDWKLEWRLAVIMAVVQLANAAVVLKLRPFADNPSLLSLWELLSLATLVGIPFLIAAVVHQDAIPGARQDWLVRPIRRKDLLLAKFLFVLVAVHGPMLLADLFRGLANGFPFGSSLAAAASRGVFVLLAFSVPLLAFASLTKNTMEAISAGLAAFLCFAGFGMSIARSLVRDAYVGSSGLSWIEDAAMILVGLAGATAVLSLQYFRRRTIAARGLAAGAGVLATLCLFLPWSPAFALERRLSPIPGAGSAAAVSFDPEMGRSRRGTEANGERASVYLPLRFEYLPANSAMISDRIGVSIGDAGGGSTRIDSESISVRQENSGGKPATYLELYVPGDLYQRIQNQSVALEIDLSLTLFQSEGVHTISALNGNARIPGMGGCVTKVNAAETAVRLGCAPLESAPSCLGLRLQHIPSGRANPAQFQCQGNYVPYHDALLVAPFSPRSVPFRDLSGLGKYPVDGSQLGESQIIIETYKAVDHFERTVAIPSIRLKDWTAE
jgi:hypothetical protein